jgi:high-affinity iron transporter
MLQSLIITLREGVEAALIIGIVFAYLQKSGRAEMKKVVLWGVGAAFVASVAVAVVISRLQFNQDIFEGFVMLVAAVFVISMIWFMQRTARTMKGKIEAKVGGMLTGNPIGLFLFVFLMVLREGVETVLILSAVSLNTTALMSFLGTLTGVLLAIAFGVLFVRGSLRINIGRFFRVTSVILYFVAFQLVISGLHELSENGILPSSRREMAFIGPIVRNDFFFFVTILALAGLMVLFEVRRRLNSGAAAESSAQAMTPAQERKKVWVARRERMWMTALTTCTFVFIMLITAQFIYAKSTTALSPATEAVLVGNQVAVPAATLTGDDLHRFTVNVDGSNVRFLLYKKPDGTIVSVADACQICGPVGFYKSGNDIICKLCASPVAGQSVGQPGGCNPVPLKSATEGGDVIITAADLRTIAPLFKK